MNVFTRLLNLVKLTNKIFESCGINWKIEFANLNPKKMFLLYLYKKIIKPGAGGVLVGEPDSR